ncbi:glutaminyl-peptide cyclotransferase [Armatimonas rosea]|uniref:Glutamine cyclotransferase n=1 Tax=Armatimonas rosea TaxID=685828 RepID=A0A7W9W637_ARMRO|nr:glutaminyl-peptide cyclotransferase [Armatimonas rosea]MBB6050223.1 glutamine cyclotransferase [Armatimonas rosea]
MFKQPPVYGFKVVNTYPHDTAAFTEGLELHNGLLYESTGLEGKSWIGIRTIENPKYQKTVSIDPQYFGEGMTIFGDKLYQLTWKNHKGFIRDKNTLKELGTFSYQGEGWALTHNDTHLIMSDGTATIRFFDPKAPGKSVKSIRVTNNGRAVTQINELEWVKGEIFANIWQTDYIIRINPSSGVVTGIIDLTGLLPGQEDVLNGIAYDAKADRLFVTGKLWSKLFEIKLIKR